MRKISDQQLAILRVMLAGDIEDGLGIAGWWIPSDFQHPLVPVHYASANQWALPKLKSLEKQLLIEKRADGGLEPDYCYRITVSGRAAVVANADRVFKLRAI